MTEKVHHVGPDTPEADASGDRPVDMSKRELLERFVGPAREHDAEMAEYWRHRSPAEHAIAGAQISDMAAEMSVQTGYGKDPDEMFPPLSLLQDQAGRSGQ